MIAYADTVPYLADINREIVNPTLRFIFVLALVFFMWGVFEYVKGSDNTGAREKGRTHMLWGLIGLFIMVGVYGILNVICNTIGCN